MLSGLSDKKLEIAKKFLYIPERKTEQLDVVGEYKFEGYDIESITRELIPENLKEKFESIIKIINQ